MSLGLGPLTIFPSFQWTQSCKSSVTAFISALAFLVLFISLAFVSIFILRLASRPGGLEQLFTAKSTYGRSWGSLYDVLHEDKLQFIILNNLASLVRNAIIGLCHGSGGSQVGTLIVLELSMCIGKGLLGFICITHLTRNLS
jgi:hypothetical protein